MATKPKTRKAQAAKLKKLAALDFESYPMDADSRVPTLEEFEPHLVASTYAFALMKK
jgi:hypothetical protein